MDIKIDAPAFFIWTMLIAFTVGMVFGIWASALPYVGTGWLLATAWLWIAGVVVLGLVVVAILRVADFRHADE